MSEDEVLSSVTLQYIESGEQFCGIYNFLNRMESFESNFVEEDIIDNLGDYIWLEEEVEAELEYQKEMDEEWKEEVMIMFAIGLAIAYIIFIILDEMLINK